MKSFFTITTVATLACISNAVDIRLQNSRSDESAALGRRSMRNLLRRYRRSASLAQQEQDSTYYNDQQGDHKEEHALTTLSNFHKQVVEPITEWVIGDFFEVFPLVIRALVLEAVDDAENQSTDPMNLIGERLQKAEHITAAMFRQNAGYIFAGFAHTLAGQGQMEVYNALYEEFDYLNYVYERIHSDFMNSLEDADVAEYEYKSYIDLVYSAHGDDDDYYGEDYYGEDDDVTLAQVGQEEEQNPPSVADILSATHDGVELVSELAEEVNDAWDSILSDVFGEIGAHLSELESLDMQTLDEAMGDLKMVSAMTSETMAQEFYGLGLSFVDQMFSIYEELGQPTDQARAAIQEWQDEMNQYHF